MLEKKNPASLMPTSFSNSCKVVYCFISCFGKKKHTKSTNQERKKLALDF